MRLEDELIEEPDPRGLPEPRVVREQRVRHRGRGRAVLQQDDGRSSRCPSRRCSPGWCRRRERSTRSSIRATAARRRAQVLDAMVETHKITPRAGRRGERGAAADQDVLPGAVAAQLLHRRGARTSCSNPNPDDPGDPANVLGATPRKRADLLYQGGLKIYTNYDPLMQYAAQICDRRTSSRARRTSSPPRSSSIDNSDGAVRAVAFGRGYDASQFDPAVDGPGRQAGSSFKAITLAAALSAGYSPERPRERRARCSWQLGPGTAATRTTTSPATATAARPRSRRRSRTPTTARSCAPSCRSGPGNYGQRRRAEGHRHGEPAWASTRRTSSPSCRRRSAPRRAPVRDGAGLLGDRGRRRAAPRATFVSKIVGPNGKVLYENDGEGHACARPSRSRAPRRRC